MEPAGLHWLPDLPLKANGTPKRPPYSIPVLAKLAIIGSPHQTLTKGEIEELLMAKFPWFKMYRYKIPESDALTTSKRLAPKAVVTRAISAKLSDTIPVPLPLTWTAELGMLLSAGVQHMWLRPHPYPSSLPGTRQGPSFVIAGVPLRC